MINIKQGYKQTEFGEIPSDWEYCTFKDVLNTFSSGATPYRAIPEYYKGDIRWISSGELDYNVIYDTIEHISDLAVKNTNLKIHEPGTFLMAITGLEAEGTRGRCAFVGAPSATNQSCLALNSTNKLRTDYLFWFYRQWGNIKCPHCGRNMTGAISTKMKKKYGKDIHYYVCWNKGCKQNNSAKIVHESFGNTICGYGLPDDMTNLLVAQMKKTFAYMNQDSAEQTSSLKNRLTKIGKDIKQVEDNWAMATEQRQIDICKRKLNELDDEKELIENELQKVESISLNLPKYIEYGIKMKNNLFNIWQLAELGEKKKIQNLVYPDGIIFNKEIGLIEPLSVNKFIALNTCKPTDNTIKEKRTTSRNDQLSPFVPEAGLEPAQP